MRLLILLAVLCAVTTAHAEVLVRGKVYQVTADRIIEREHMRCEYGPWEHVTLRNGSTVLSRGKTCTKASKQ